MIAVYIALIIFPTINYSLYTTLASFVCLLSFKVTKKRLVNAFLAVTVPIFIILARSLSVVNTQELQEIVRILFIVFIFSFQFKSWQIKSLIKANEIALIALFFISLMQWINPYSNIWADLVNILYNEGHYTGGIRLQYPRATGYMSNIAESSIFFLFNTIYFFYLNHKTKSSKYLLYYYISIIGVLMTQSKTSMIILICILIFHFLFYSNFKTKIISLTLLVFPTIYLADLIRNIDQIGRLLDVGIGTTSFSFRINSWLEIINSYSESSTIQFLFGFGRSNILMPTTTLDSDFFFTLQLFGLTGIFLVIYFIYKYILITLKFHPILRIGIMFMFPALFLLDVIYNPKLAVIIFLFLQLFNYESLIRSDKLQRTKDY